MHVSICFLKSISPPTCTFIRSISGCSSCFGLNFKSKVFILVVMKICFPLLMYSVMVLLLVINLMSISLQGQRSLSIVTLFFIIHSSLHVQMILNQSVHSDNPILWESQLEYHVCRNHWKEVFRLLNLMPAYVLSAGSLQLNLDLVEPASSLGCNMNMKSSNYGNFLCSFEELDSVCMEVPNVQMYRFSPDICSGWMRMLVEEKLAKRFIFFKEYWEGTLEMIALLARSGFISGRDKICLEDDLTKMSSVRDGAVQALHKIFVHHCAQYNLPNLLDLYLDHHRLALENDSLYALQETAVSFFVPIVCYCYSD